MRKLLLILPLLFCTYVSDLSAQDFTVVVPNANEDVAGNSNNAIPFNNIPAQRYQQIYSSDQFPSVCGRILQINFRNIIGPDNTSVTYPDVSIQLSTTSVSPNTLSNRFSDNIGPDVITVYEGELTFTSQECELTPCSFDNSIVLQTPFIYNPRDGNLLFDITKQMSPAYRQFDYQELDGQLATNRLFSEAGDPDSETGTVGDNDGGFITQFVCEPIPRAIPALSEWGLIAMAGIIGLAGLIAVRRKYAVN